MNSRTIVLLAVLVLAAAGAVFYYSGRSSNTVPKPSQIATLDGQCLACGKYVTAEYDMLEGQPAVCPSCNERAVYATYFCQHCNHRFVPNLEPRDGELPKVPMVPRCPTCGSTRIYGYLADDPDAQNATEGPRPGWPPK